MPALPTEQRGDEQRADERWPLLAARPGTRRGWGETDVMKRFYLRLRGEYDAYLTRDQTRISMKLRKTVARAVALAVLAAPLSLAVAGAEGAAQAATPPR